MNEEITENGFENLKHDGSSELNHIPRQESDSDSKNFRRDLSPDDFDYLSERSVSPYITNYLNNNNVIKTPSTISNLSGLLSNVDFIASPSVIHKVGDVASSSISTIGSEFRNEEFDRNYIEKRKVGDECIDNINSMTYLDLDDYTLHNYNINEDNMSTQSKSNTSTSILQTTVLENIHEVNDSYGINTSIFQRKEHISKSLGKPIEENDILNYQNSIRKKNESEIETKTKEENKPEEEKQTEEENKPGAENKSEGENGSEEENTEVYCKTLTRKRKQNTNEWQDKKNKLLKNSGQSYTGVRSKKVYPSKSIRDSCNCKKKCCEKFNEESRKAIFESYWRIGDHEGQWQYILRYIIVNNIKRMQIERKANRLQTITYFLPLNGSKEQVCKSFFLNTLSISERSVYTAIEKSKNDENIKDKRGTHHNRPRKMNIWTEHSILTHIKLFPVVESHYTRKQSKRLYLSENLNVSKMYRLYNEWFSNYKTDYPDTTEATKRQYETIFNTRFNYSFFKPNKDRCAACALYEEAEEERKVTLEETYRAHLKNKEKVREIKNNEKSTSDPKVTTVATFDLEKVLNIPQSNEGVFYYKRKYPIYNFTIFNILNLQGYCYVWHYEIAKRGTIEIGSCLLNFIENEHTKGIQNISFFSDSCAGQNKNKFIFALYLYVTKKYGINITHRFFEVGHSQSEGDAMHSCIERAKNNKIIYTPDQMYAIILNSKIQGKTYVLKEMQQSDFYDIKELIDKRYWLRDFKGNKVMWSKIKQVSTFGTDPDTLFFKYDLESEFESLKTFSKYTRGRRSKKNNDTDANIPDSIDILKQAYNTPFSIPKPLYYDLLNLCKTEAIPKHYHGFYKSLKCDECNQSHETHETGLVSINLQKMIETRPYIVIKTINIVD
ncbi:unnamed protein product [Diatraea saccharalis]|uniref:DUF7869 domain-containing protein n=1 Tax=Diatraea saccharalis TaxID=40085 RepID=A0A9N9N3T7_9NEOP|nr:unnamed protein product [Diatraea saccharalis]